jgi:GntR family transcriptional regulator/MocR family aminotransferase
MGTLKSLYRYPLKGFSAQALDGELLAVDQPFPFDRLHALTRPGSKVDPQSPQWAHKSNFVMLMQDEALATFDTDYEVASGRLVVQNQGRLVLDVSLGDSQGREEFETLITRTLALTDAATPISLVSALPGSELHFMDKPDAVISVINLASVRALSHDLGCEIDPMRFRANLYIDDAEPWAEFDWIGKSIELGQTQLVVDRRNTRCAATNVNPKTAERDQTLPKSLRNLYGHCDMGVYVKVARGGRINCGDEIKVRM